MIFDLLLDTNTHDLVFDDTGFIELAEDVVCVAQKVEVRLKTHTLEWIFDQSMGINYRGRVLVKNPDERVTRSLFAVEIQRVDEVTALRSITIDTTGRDLALAFDAETTEGAISGGL